jgi:predicted AAA+ superfamily ATPase
MKKAHTDLFDRPSGLGDTRVEYLFNKEYGTLPSKVYVGDPLDLEKTSQFISDNFDPLNSEFAFKGGKLSESGFWLGKGEYLDIILEVSDYGRSREYLPYISEESYNLNKPKQVKTCSVQACGGSPEKLKKLGEELSKFKHEAEAKIYLLVSEHGDTDLRPLDVPVIDTNLELNYGPEFKEVHDIVIDSLKNKSSGLYLFYGDPGTGKSSYIKHLLSTVKNRKIVYIPISLIDSLTSPNFLPLLMSNRNMILVIEDAEKALLSREEDRGNSSLVSTILNLTDSFISSTLNVSIIATFNTKKENLDKALLRKGRLKVSHEFKKLSVEDSQKLIDSLGVKHTATESMSIADIYYLDEDNRHEEDEKDDRVIGFGKS